MPNIYIFGKLRQPDGYLQDHILSFPKMYIFGIFIIDQLLFFSFKNGVPIGITMR